MLLVCDRDWLTEAIDNIVENALDHTERGDTVHIEWRALTSTIQIVVKDNGCGIHPEDLEGDFLRQQCEDIIPGYYMNKMHWNSVKPDGEVPDDLLKDLLDKSYQLVLGGFSKKEAAGDIGGRQSLRMSSCGI